MDIYQKLVGESSKFGEKNDCGVKALSVITGIDYAECHRALSRLGRKKCGATRLGSIFEALKQFGFKFVEVQCPYNGMRSLGRNLPSKGSFLIFATNHFAGAKDGKIHDWSDGRCLRIKRFFQIQKAEDCSPTFAFKQVTTNKRQSTKTYRLVHNSGKVAAEYKRFPSKINYVIAKNGTFKVWGRVIKANEFVLQRV